MASISRLRDRATFLAKVVIANVIAFFLLFALSEISVRIWREGSVLAGMRTLVTAEPMPASLGVGDWLQSDPARGYVLRAGVHGTNELHIRHRPLASPKPRDEFRLLVLGDSVAFPEDGFVAMLRADQSRASAHRVEIINAAVPGYTTWQEARHLEALIDAVEPNAVLLQYCCNDNHRFLHQLTADGSWLVTEEARRALLPEGDGLSLRVARWSYLAIEARRLALAHRPKDLAFPWRDQPEFLPAWREEGWAVVRDALADMAQLCRAKGIAMAVVAVPYEPQLSDAALQQGESHSLFPQRQLAAACATLSLPLLDLVTAFRATSSDGLYTDRIHLSPVGHAVAARALLPFARAAGLLPE